MNTVSKFLAFPFKLLGWFFKITGYALLALLVVFILVWGYRAYQFWFAPTDTEIGPDTTRFALLQAIDAARNKTDPDCDPTMGTLMNLANDAGKMPTFVIVGLRSGKIKWYDVPMFIAELPWFTADGLLWGFAESGYNSRAAGVSTKDQCRLPKSFVKLPIEDSWYMRDYLGRTGIDTSQLPLINFK